MTYKFAPKPKDEEGKVINLPPDQKVIIKTVPAIMEEKETTFTIAINEASIQELQKERATHLNKMDTAIAFLQEEIDQAKTALNI